MDFIGNKCPVCEKYFHADDDIVVCPECGTPHHRECYEAKGHCHNEKLHAEGYDFTASNENVKSDIKICKSCGKENESDAFFCKYCASPLTSADRQNVNAGNPTGVNHPNNPYGNSQNGTPYSMPYFDPLGGVPADTDLGDGVTAGETAKYVKQNTPYFMRIFSNIKNLNRSRFNFAAAIFSGGYMLYRKMYKLGAIITAIQAAMMILSIYIQYVYASVYISLSNIYATAATTTELIDNMSAAMSGLSSVDVMLIYLPVVLDIIGLIMMIVIGATFNRLYMNHCKKQIIRIKTDTEEGTNPETLLQTKGGVNMPLAISLLITSMLINYLPSFIIGLI